MIPRIEIIAPKKLIGKRSAMSLVDNTTAALWRNFMPVRKLINNRVNDELISMQVYGPGYSFAQFDPAATFEKWAAVEVKDAGSVPDDMEVYMLPGGLYAVFLHKGAASEGPKTFGYIFGTWLPGSEYELDNRPHFEVLGEKYRNEQPDSEEEIWIPIKHR